MTISSALSISLRICLPALLASAGLAQSPTDRVVYLFRQPITTQEKQSLFSAIGPAIRPPAAATPIPNLLAALSNLTATDMRAPASFLTPLDRLRSVLTPNPKLDPQLDAEYKRLDPAKSLLVNNCDGFCDDDFFSFERILKKVAAATAMRDQSRVYATWYAEAAKLEGFQNHVRPYPKYGPAEAFQLLAVVNRLDLAEPDGSGANWGKAELRFVYGAMPTSGTPGAEPLTAIVEFVLPFRPWKDFRTIAQGWADLSHSPAFPKALKALLQQSWSPVADSAGGASEVRLRANFQAGGAGLPWTMAQWEFSKKGPVEKNLDDEMNGNCTGRQILAFGFCQTPEPKSCEAYLPMYAQFAMQPALTQSVQAPTLLVQRQCYFVASPIMPGPANVCSTDPRARPPAGITYLARNVFALQQCTGCHGAEGNPTFLHIANRLPKETESRLSLFLTGGNPKATEPQLNRNDSNAVAKVELDAPWPDSKACGTADTTVHVVRLFNDLARRRLFLASVLVVGASAPPDKAWAGVIVGFGPDMTH